MADETTPASPAPAAAAPPPRRRRRFLLWTLALLAVLCLVTAAGLYGLWQSTATLAWGLARVPGLQVQGVRGSLAAGRLEIDQLDWAGDSGRLQLQGLVADGIAWPGFGDRLRIGQLRARLLVWHSGPPAKTPPQPPTDLRLPLALDLPALRIDRLQIDTLPPLLALQAGLSLGAEGGREHRVDALQLDWEQARLHGSARLGSTGTLPLQAQLQAESIGARRWRADAEASGPLSALVLQLKAAGEPEPGHAAPTLQASARLAPFAAWPLAALRVSTQQLDLAALSARLPQTALAGQAELQSSGLDRPARLDLQLANALPGRWDAQRLPLKQITLVAGGELRRTDQLDLQQFEVALADEQASAGTLRGSGRWQGERLSLALQLDGLQPARLDARAAPVRLSGPLTLSVSNLPWPAAATPAAAASAPPSAASAPAGPAPGPQVAVQARLAGQGLDGSGGPVQLTLEADGDAQRWRLKRAEASAGAARASASGEAQRAGNGWQLALKTAFAQFDPLPWWRGDAQSPWRRGPHRLNGTAEARLLWPDAPAGGRPRPPLSRGTGSAQLTLADSQLAGVPVSGQLSLDLQDARLSVDARWQAAGNRLVATGQWQDSAMPEARQRATLQLQAPALAAMAPVMRLVAATAPELAGWLPSAGTLEAEASLDAHWPAWRSSGQARARGLRSPRGALDQADLSWTGSEQPEAPLALKFEARGMRLDDLPVDRVDAQLSGSLRQHQLKFMADSPARPPAWSESLIGPVGSGTRIDAELRGAWQHLPDSSSRWQLQGLQLRGGSRDTPSGSAPWLTLADVSGELSLDAAGQPQALQLAPGRVQLLGAALRWREARWQAAAAQQLTVAAELETIDVARWLQRLQPTMGWSGDLSVGGRIDIRAAEQVDADIVLQRLGGDLAITDELGNRQALGLEELRLGLGVHDGLWQFAQGLAGRQVGQIAGAQVIRSKPASRWPEPDAPMQGVLQAHVANLGIWGAWVPPGWRLAGELRTTATLSGKFKGPELRGELRGSGLGVRNLLAGVNVSDGELAITLAGDQAKVERFDFRGGDGRLSLSGGAQLGAQPSAQLQLVAEHFRVLGRIDRRVVASGQAALKLDATRLQLDGQVSIDEGLIDLSQGDAPRLDSDVQVLRAPPPASAPMAALPPAAAASANAAAAAARPAPAGPLRNAQVDLRVDLGQKLQLRGRGIDTGLRGELRVSSPGGKLALNGSVTTHGGTYAAYGQKLEISRGEIVFTGSMDNPRLDVLAIRPNLDVIVGVSVAGNAQNPRVRLTSEPEMAEFDKLSWLVLGRGPEGLGRTDTALLQRAAVALLAGSNEKGPTDKLIESLGLTDFSLRQTDGEVRETVVSLGRQLSRRWYVGYERSVNATTGTWQLIYRVARRFTLRAQSGSENSVDMIWSWRW
ncbi:translocation/assembly module TamB domain-containing protein [Aquabacterium sp.]|uniref:translocation/assembly module TamB domain-containing protein n=1 Tax=Aquabacterium sp. TaxID=1872578 RepID=UPI003784A0D4